MSEETQPPRTLHDRLFKEFLHRFLPDFLWIFFPAEAERLNFATLQFLDKELIINFAGQELRITDIVAEVATWEGVAETIIVHLEVEGRDKVTLPQRMSEYYALLRLFRRKPVLPLALVLLPNTGGLDWQSYQESIFGHAVLHFRYGQVGIRDLSSRQYLAENSPVAAALTVLMEPAGESPALLKLEAMQKVVESDLSDGDKLFLFEFMNTYAPTSELSDPREAIMDKLLTVEKTWGDRLRSEGKLEGERTMLLRLLTLMFGEAPTSVVEHIRAIRDEETLAQVAQQLVTIQSLDELILPEMAE
ncbi:MAG: hypothetical protein ACOYNY_31815 [Caldilineaceae bacterium]